jgi:hypothetical protein
MPAVLLNHGDGTFAAHVPYECGEAVSAELGDFDGSGYLDAAVANHTQNQVSVLLNLCEDCPPDINGDGDVTVLDLLMLLAAWGPCPSCPEDINGDGEVSVLDLLELLAAWGPCP